MGGKTLKKVNSKKKKRNEQIKKASPQSQMMPMDFGTRRSLFID
jgi:hypothetical protein